MIEHRLKQLLRASVVAQASFITAFFVLMPNQTPNSDGLPFLHGPQTALRSIPQDDPIKATSTQLSFVDLKDISRAFAALQHSPLHEESVGPYYLRQQRKKIDCPKGKPRSRISQEVSSDVSSLTVTSPIA